MTKDDTTDEEGMVVQTPDRTRHNWSRALSSPFSTAKKSALVCTQTLGNVAPGKSPREELAAKISMH